MGFLLLGVAILIYSCMVSAIHTEMEKDEKKVKPIVFNHGKTYRHQYKGNDLDILILSVYSRNEERTKMKVQYINKHTGGIQYTGKGRKGDTDTISIKSKVYHHWRVLDV